MKNRYFYNPILVKSGDKYLISIYRNDRKGSHVVTNVSRKTYADTLKMARELVDNLNTSGSNGRMLRRMFK